MGIIVRNMSSSGLSNIRVGSNKATTDTLDLDGFDSISAYNKDTGELVFSDISHTVNTIPLKNNTYYEMEHLHVGYAMYGIGYGGIHSGIFAMYGNFAPNSTMWTQTAINSDSRFTNPASIASNGSISGMLFKDMKIHIFINGVLIHTFDDIKDNEEYYAKFGNGGSYSSTRFRIITKDFIYRDVSLAQI